MYQQAPPKKSGPGMGTALLAGMYRPSYHVVTYSQLLVTQGGAGLVGGALLMDAFEDHDRDEYQDGYDQGS